MFMTNMINNNDRNKSNTIMKSENKITG